MFRYRHHVIDTTLPKGAYGQTALADLNNDGRPEFMLGQQTGDLYYYVYRSPEHWDRYLLGKDSPSDVGAAVLDVDGDGWLDVVTGGVWYRNSRRDGVPFERIVFDPELHSVHDVLLADMDGDGRIEVVTMSDRNDLRWYKIPANPRDHWPHTRIGSPVHAGAATGDIAGRGFTDVVRTNVWYENVRGDGSLWREHPLPFPPQEQSRLTNDFMVDATQSFVLDMDRDGHNDVIMVENEMTGGKLFWLENVAGDGSQWVRHDIAIPNPPIRGAYHSLWVGDADADGDLDIISAEMEDIRGEQAPKYYLWENVDGYGQQWREHVILDANLGGHLLVAGDVQGNGRLDILSKPWNTYEHNAVGGKPFVVYLENLGPVEE